MYRSLKHMGLASLCTVTAAFTVNCSSGGGGGGGRALSTQEAALNKSITAVSSLADLAVAAYAPIDSMRAQATDDFCNSNGMSTVTGDDGTWAFSSFLCAGTHNSYSPDTALGTLSLMKGVICTADQNGVSYSASGATATMTNTPLTATCFSKEMLAMFAQEEISTISGTVTAYAMTNSGWDYRLEFTNMSAPLSNFTMYVRSSGNVTAAAYTSTTDGSWSVTIDQRTSTNRIIFEAVNDNRHIRLLAEGTISATGTVTAVTHMGGVVAEAADAQYVALHGADATGVNINSLKNEMGATEHQDVCFDTAGNGSCPPSVPLAAVGFDAGDRVNFTNNAAVTSAMNNFDNNPLFYDYASFVSTIAHAAPAGSVSDTLR